MVTVYSGPGCPSCKLTYDWLARNNIPHKVVDIHTDEIGRQWMADRGLRSLPVVSVGQDVFWTGFNPPKLKTLLTTTAV